MLRERRESVSVSTKVRFGPFRSVSVPRESVSVLRERRESVTVSTKVLFGPFRSVSVNCDTDQGGLFNPVYLVYLHDLPEKIFGGETTREEMFLGRND